MTNSGLGMGDAMCLYPLFSSAIGGDHWGPTIPCMKGFSNLLFLKVFHNGDLSLEIVLGFPITMSLMCLGVVSIA